jgi:hypothetical protein
MNLLSIVHGTKNTIFMFPSSDAKAAVLAPCDATNCTVMGIEAEFFPARGTFYVATQANTPYCSKYIYQNCKTLDGEGEGFFTYFYTNR